MVLHQAVSLKLHGKGLHDQWKSSPTYIRACDLLGLPYSGDTLRQKRKSAREQLINELGWTEDRWM